MRRGRGGEEEARDPLSQAVKQGGKRQSVSSASPGSASPLTGHHNQPSDLLEHSRRGEKEARAGEEGPSTR